MQSTATGRYCLSDNSLRILLGELETELDNLATVEEKYGLLKKKLAAVDAGFPKALAAFRQAHHRFTDWIESLIRSAKTP